MDNDVQLLPLNLPTNEFCEHLLLETVLFQQCGGVALSSEFDINIKVVRDRSPITLVWQILKLLWMISTRPFSWFGDFVHLIYMLSYLCFQCMNSMLALLHGNIKMFNHFCKFYFGVEMAGCRQFQLLPFVRQKVTFLFYSWINRQSLFFRERINISPFVVLIMRI